MGKVKVKAPVPADRVDSFAAVLGLLVSANRGALPSGMLHQFAELFVTYREAALNLAKCGAVVAHPKTGAPVENPYLVVRADTLAALRKFARIKADRVWAALSAELGTDAGKDSQKIPA